MTELETDTLLDLLVNVVPIAILLLFSLLFAISNPWGWDPFPVLVSQFLTLFPLVVLAVLTYVAGRVVQRDESKTSEP